MVTVGASIPAKGGNPYLYMADLTELTPGLATTIIPIDTTGAEFVADCVLPLGISMDLADTIRLNPDGEGDLFALGGWVGMYLSGASPTAIGVAGIEITMNIGNGFILFWKDPRLPTMTME